MAQIQWLSDYQYTVEDLEDLSELAQLPANSEKQNFVELCSGYWSETSGLLDQATAMQQKRLKQLQWVTSMNKSNCRYRPRLKKADLNNI